MTHLPTTRTSRLALGLGAALAAAGLGSAAQAQNWSAEVFGGARLEGELGYGGADLDTDTGYFYGVRGLYTPGNPNLSYGLEISRSEAEYTGLGARSSATGAFGILRYTLPTKGPISPYVTAGLGVLDVDYNGATAGAAFSGNDQQLGGSLALGVAYEVSDRVGIFGEFNHRRAFEDSTIAGVGDVEYQSNNVAVGVRFNF